MTIEEITSKVDQLVQDNNRLLAENRKLKDPKKQKQQLASAEEIDKVLEGLMPGSKKIVKANNTPEDKAIDQVFKSLNF